MFGARLSHGLRKELKMTTGHSQFCGRTRREMLWELGGGFGSVALAGMLGNDFFSGSSVHAEGE